MKIIDSVNIDPLLKAFSQFERFRVNDKTEQERAGIIKSFDCSFDLSWKTMKKLLEARGSIANSPRETFRMAALENFIENPEIWFDFIKKHNMTVHTYNQNQADEVIAISELFSLEVKKFLHNIGASLRLI